MTRYQMSRRQTTLNPRDRQNSSTLTLDRPIHQYNNQPHPAPTPPTQQHRTIRTSPSTQFHSPPFSRPLRVYFNKHRRILHQYTCAGSAYLCFAFRASPIQFQQIQKKCQLYNLKMSAKILICLCLSLLLLQLSAHQPLLQVNSSQSHSAFHFTLSLQTSQYFNMFSRRLLKAPHWTTVNTYGPQASCSPSLNEDSVLLNVQHDGRIWMEFFEQAPPTPQAHFHYIEVERQNEVSGYLLPAFTHKVPGFRTDSLYRCSNALVSVTRNEGDAHIVVFSEKDQWRMVQNVDDGFRGGQNDIFYGYAADFDHSNPIIIEIGDQSFCTITTDTPNAKVQLNWRDSDTFSLDDILYAAGDSLPIEKKPKRFTEEL